MKTVASRYDEYVSVKDLSDRINRALTSAKKDNDFIYHDRVPEIKDLEHIGKAALVKATPITTPLSQKFTGETDSGIINKQRTLNKAQLSSQLASCLGVSSSKIPCHVQLT